MPAPSTVDEFLDLVRKSEVVDDKRLATYLDRVRTTEVLPTEPAALAGLLVRDGILTHFQAEQFLLGKWRRFTIGKYKVLERLGSGGMGSVYLCEHKLMRRRVAVKVLPTAKADDPSSLERFYREARCVAALDHPNIVRAYDIDQDDKLHFLVMEHVDGSSLQEIIKKNGPMDVLRATHYIRQAALGLQHAHETAGLVHRDVKPGNVLVDRNGIVKILDMGLARFFHDEEDVLTKKYDENVLGTADYLAPEQALDSHAVDIRADIYSLGATFYFCLTGRTPFAEGTVAQKLIWHQTRQPKSVRLLRPEVQPGLASVLEKMMAKNPEARYQTPLEVAQALEPWTRTPIPPPPASEMPQLSRAAMGGSVLETNVAGSPRPVSGPVSPAPRKSWQVPLTPQPAAKPVQAPRPQSPPPPKSNLRNGTVPPPAGPAPRPAAPKAPPAPEARATPAPPARATPPAPSRPVKKAAPQASPAPANGTRTVDQPRREEEVAPWEELAAGDTDHALARADTDPKNARKSSPVNPVLQSRVVPPFAGHDRRFWLTMISIVLLVLAVLGVLSWLVLNPRGDKSSPFSEIRPPLIVHPSGENGAFRTLTQALLKARTGDRILVQADVTDALPPIGLKDLTIEAAPGKAVRWRFPEKPDPSVKKLLSLHDAEGFRLKGFTLDGCNRADFLVQVSGRCPGLVLEDLRLTNFVKCGIVVLNCEGTPERRLTFANLHILTSQPAQTALFFDVKENLPGKRPTNAHLTVRECDFVGPGEKIKASRPDILAKTVELPPGVNVVLGP
jgi:serine/threonine protein kinase